VRRCIGFARSWGYGWLDVLNLFAYRSTDPAAVLDAAEDRSGDPDNIHTISRVVAGASIVVAAWGAFKIPRMRWAQVVGAVASAYGPALHCLGVTRDGSPRHPLFVSSDTGPSLYPVARDARFRPIEIGQRVCSTLEATVHHVLRGVVRRIDGIRVGVELTEVEPKSDAAGPEAGQLWTANAWAWEKER